MLKKNKQKPRQDPEPYKEINFISPPPLEEVIKVNYEVLSPYPNHPFKPYTSEMLDSLAESIRRDGLQQPVIVREVEDQFEYIILSGHNRVAAMIKLGIRDIPCIVRTMGDNAAAMVVVNTNLEQRDKLLPGEKVFAYKLQREAMQNRDLLSDPNTDHNASTGWTGDSSMAYYYIRLTELSTGLLNLVDEGKIPVKSGVELSYMNLDAQKSVLQYLGSPAKKLSVKDASALRGAYDDGKPITVESISAILNKSIRKTKSCIINSKLITKYKIPDNIDLIKIICEMLEERFGRA